MSWVEGRIVVGATRLAGYLSDREQYAVLVGEARAAVANDDQPDQPEPLPA